MSTKFNGIRKLRNRIFHHESISWNFEVLLNYKNEITQAIDWFDRSLVDWCSDIFKLEQVIEKYRKIIK